MRKWFKNLFSLLMVLSVITLTGCAWAKEGDYKFVSLTIIEGEEQNTYKCTKVESDENPSIKSVCSMFKGMELELDDNELTMEFHAEGADDYEETVDYKISGSTLKVWNDETAEYEKKGTFKKDKLVMDVMHNVKVTFRKR